MAFILIFLATVSIIGCITGEDRHDASSITVTTKFALSKNGIPRIIKVPQVTSLWKRIKLLSGKIQTMQTKLGLAKHKFAKVVEKIDELENKVNKRHERAGFCNLLLKNPCGKCRCQEDDRLIDKYFCNCQHLKPMKDCVDFLNKGYKTSGVYIISQHNKRMQIFCDQVTDGGGWAVFQRRVDGSINFYRNWESYKRGFGSLQHEFWLGNDNLFTMTHQVAHSKGTELRIEMQYWTGTKLYAKYNKFQVSNELAKYSLHVSGYSGNIGDGLRVHNGKPFTTFDRDNDQWSNNCAESFKGGWWYGSCHHANLNGRYYFYKEKYPHASGIHWYKFDQEKKSMKFVEMKLRKKQ